MLYTILFIQGKKLFVTYYLPSIFRFFKEKKKSFTSFVFEKMNNLKLVIYILHRTHEI